MASALLRRRGEPFSPRQPRLLHFDAFTLHTHTHILSKSSQRKRALFFSARKPICIALPPLLPGGRGLFFHDSICFFLSYPSHLSLAACFASSVVALLALFLTGHGNSSRHWMPKRNPSCTTCSPHLYFASFFLSGEGGHDIPCPSQKRTSGRLGGTYTGMYRSGKGPRKKTRAADGNGLKRFCLHRCLAASLFE